METKVDEVLVISKELIAFEEEARALREKINYARERLAALLGERGKPKGARKPRATQVDDTTPEGPSSPSPQGVTRRKYGQRGTTRDLLEYMKSIPGRHVSPGDVVAALNRPGENQVFSRLLQRLANEGLIERTHRGLYRFNEGNETK